MILICFRHQWKEKNYRGWEGYLKTGRDLCSGSELDLVWLTGWYEDKAVSINLLLRSIKNPICARDLQGTHLINNLVPSSSLRDSLSHLCRYSFFLVCQVSPNEDDVWRESASVTSCFSQHANTLTSDDPTMGPCSTVNKTWSSVCKEPALFADPNRSSSLSFQLLVFNMNEDCWSKQPPTRRTRCRASLCFLPHLGWY